MNNEWILLTLLKFQWHMPLNINIKHSSVSNYDKIYFHWMYAICIFEYGIRFWHKFNRIYSKNQTNLANKLFNKVRKVKNKVYFITTVSNLFGLMVPNLLYFLTSTFCKVSWWSAMQSNAAHHRSSTLREKKKPHPVWNMNEKVILPMQSCLYCIDLTYFVSK